jgi:perosamine synthetase
MFLRDTGRHHKIPYWTVETTHKYMPFNIQAAIGLAQFHRLEELLAKKREIFGWYKKHLASLPDIQMNQDDDLVKNGLWATSLVFGKSHKMKKKEMMAELSRAGLPTRPFFYPLSMVPAFKNNISGSKKINPISYSVSERGITLPSSFHLTEKDVKIYTEAIKKILSGK